MVQAKGPSTVHSLGRVGVVHMDHLITWSNPPVNRTVTTENITFPRTNHVIGVEMSDTASSQQ